MGYSCTQDAANTLAVIGKMFNTDGNANILTIRGEQYFFERGREQADGAITGKLYQMLPNDLCRSVGNVRINADGSIKCFPRLKVAETIEAENTMRDMAARNPHLLHSWSLGRV
jgi:hypothetical protein